MWLAGAILSLSQRKSWFPGGCSAPGAYPQAVCKQLTAVTALSFMNGALSELISSTGLTIPSRIYSAALLLSP
ncbi:hypothetical protein HGRIS_011771 [Hohenbuehelia grisea]|uniref:Uncharacterized protein n=1 Tax=Hohenbuehelia grisea TaxID=104357 RepID=A0ABR3JXK0_9AGAR